MPFRETTPPPDLPTEQVPLEVYVAAKRAHIQAIRDRAEYIETMPDGVVIPMQQSILLRAEAQVLEYDLQNFLFSVKQHQLTEERMKQEQQQQIITANLRPKPGRMI